MEKKTEKLISQKLWTEDSLWHFEFRNPQVPYPLHSHNFYELVFIYSGTGTHILENGETRRLQAGDVICVKPGQVHGYKNLENLVLMNLLVRPDFFDLCEPELEKLPNFHKLFSDSKNPVQKGTFPTIFNINKMQMFEIRAIIEDMQSEVDKQHIGWNFMGIAYLYQLILLLLRIFHDPNYPDTIEQNSAAKLIKYVEKNYAKKLTMQDLIENGNMSESTILRNFKRITGYPPFEYQMRQRMFAAIQKLIYTDWDITQIAYDVGFNDSNYFSRCFKKFINMTPKEYRQKYKTTQN